MFLNAFPYVFKMRLLIGLNAFPYLSMRFLGLLEGSCLRHTTFDMSLTMEDTFSLNLRMHHTPLIPKLTTLVCPQKWEIPFHSNYTCTPPPNP